ncbi:MAG TPA: cellulose binding domain-containing protein [Bacillota bacterium]
MKRPVLGLFLAIVVLVAVFNLFTTQAAPNGFVYREGKNFMLNGKIFRFGGANNYYLHYKSTSMIDDVLNDAVAMNLKVIRCWAFMNGNGQENIVMQPSLGVYDDAGFARLDYTLQKAESLGLKLILVLVNNWDDFGGMNQYVNWTGAGNHDAFYTNAQCKQAYKNYVKYVINRTNSLTEVQYKDCPAIFAWELGNEPRCQSDSTGRTLVEWADEMSTYIKSIDPNHMVSVGDEGFFARKEETDWFYNGGEGVDWDSLIALKNIDFGTVHLYPDHWGKTAEWGIQWIKDHAPKEKPVILEEYGIRGDKDKVYQTWCETALNCGYNGTMFWILTGIQDDGQLYADYDGFRVVYPSTTATILAEHAKAMAGNPSFTTTPTTTSTIIPTAPATVSPTTTPPVTSTNTNTPTTTPSLSGSCAVSYSQNDWGSGATVNISIENNGSNMINGWNLTFSFPGNQQITNMWCAKYTQSGAAVTVTNEAWNGTIPAGGSVNFGFNISYSGSNSKPSSFTLNGAPCTVD